jgi:predicted flavoprotein YhiN
MKTFTSLSGISLPVRIKIKDKIFKENLLFAHIGITGPAVLNASLYTDVGNTLEIDFIPNRDLKKLPKRVYTFFQNYFNTTQKDQLLKYLSEFKFDYSGSFGYQKAEVMRGGIWLGYLNKYLESSKYPNLYFIGECLDITGELGGYNLHFAFASAITASLSINKKA